jgi:hypothetical protein
MRCLPTRSLSMRCLPMRNLSMRYLSMRCDGLKPDEASGRA